MIVPLSLNPALGETTELTLTVPLFVSATPMLSVPVTFSVPALLNVRPLLLLYGLISPEGKFQVCCDSLMMLAPL